MSTKTFADVNAEFAADVAAANARNEVPDMIVATALPESPAEFSQLCTATCMWYKGVYLWQPIEAEQKNPTMASHTQTARMMIAQMQRDNISREAAVRAVESRLTPRSRALHAPTRWERATMRGACARPRARDAAALDS